MGHVRVHDVPTPMASGPQIKPIKCIAHGSGEVVGIHSTMSITADMNSKFLI